MNDRAVSLLDQYELEVLDTRKGRDAILCDTSRGCLILKEYRGQKERLVCQNMLLASIKEQGFCWGEEILATKEGELFVKDRDGVDYILKTYPDGRECDITQPEELEQAVTLLGRLHQAMPKPSEDEIDKRTDSYALREYEKKNRELVRVRKYLRNKGQKNPFEMELSKVYDRFMEQAAVVTESWKKELYDNQDSSFCQELSYCHGDFQYHNLLYREGQWYIINFEKYVIDNPVRDLYLLLRKLLEKSDWSEELGHRMIAAYERVNPLSPASRLDLYYRLSYPEKFRKIVNYYYNTGKAFIPGKNVEKLEKILQQEEKKRDFLRRYHC